MDKSEEWAVDISRIAEFFCSQSDVNQSAEGFRYRSCRIHLEKLPDKRMGGLSFPQTRVDFNGKESDLKIIYHRFFMRFVSAGG